MFMLSRTQCRVLYFFSGKGERKIKRVIKKKGRKKLNFQNKNKLFSETRIG